MNEFKWIVAIYIITSMATKYLNSFFRKAPVIALKRLDFLPTPKKEDITSVVDG